MLRYYKDIENLFFNLIGENMLEVKPLDNEDLFHRKGEIKKNGK